MAESEQTQASSSEPNLPASEVLEKIVSGLRDRGEVVIVKEGVRTGADVLLERGLKWEAVVATFLARPDLFQVSGEDWQRSFAFLADLGMPHIHILETLGREPPILRKSPDELNKKVHLLTRIGIHGTRLSLAVKRCPALLLHLEYRKAYDLLNVITSFFSREEALKLVVGAPRMLFMRPEEVEANYEYIHLQMGLETQDFLRCRRWPLLPLFTIKARHEFLSRTGAYKKPHPKRPFLSASNPSLCEILDSPNKVFATYVAKVSQEEWNVFREIYERENREEDELQLLVESEAELTQTHFTDDLPAATERLTQPEIDNEFATSKPFFGTSRRS